jgi:hypothetical protein
MPRDLTTGTFEAAAKECRLHLAEMQEPGAAAAVCAAGWFNRQAGLRAARTSNVRIAGFHSFQS